MSEQDSSAVQKKGTVVVSCRVCNLAATTFCGNCNTVAYCSRECQLKDWKTGSHGGSSHRENCKELALLKKQCDKLIGVKRFPKAIYHNYRGKETFTGMVLVSEDMVTTKLDDPNGELDGPSHVMCSAELMSEMCHYDGQEGCPSHEIRDKLKSVDLFDFFHEADAEFRRNFPDSQDEEFDIKYPHGLPGGGVHGNVQQVRSGDHVKVVAHGLIDGQKFLERFCVFVHSVTATLPDGTNIVMGTTNCNLNGVDLKKGEMLAFPVTCVLGVKHGINW
jgi:hypothetical protein